MAREALLVAPLAALALAGCLSIGGTQPLDPSDALPALDDVLAALPLDADHDHADVAAHAAGWNMALAAYLPLNEDGGRWTFGEADVVGDLAYVATLSPRGGFVVLDVKDPASPTVVGRYDAATTYAADLKVTDDGKWAVLGSQLLANQQAWMPPMHLPPAEPGSAAINGFQLVSLADPAKPQLVGYLPVDPYGVHMLDTHAIGGATYAFGAPGFGGHVTIARIVEGPLGTGALVPVGRYTFGRSDGNAGFAGGPHDITVYDDEQLGAVMLVAAGVEGVHVVDVNDPARPKLLGTWAEHEGLYVHTVMPALVEGQRLIVAVPETWTADAQQPLWILDAQDPGALATRAVWRLPGDPKPYDGDYLFSTHNINVRDGVIYLAHFHAGVWLLDIGTLAKASAPEPLGVFLPGEAANLGLGEGLGLEAAPLVWDAVPLGNGHVLLTDIPTGVYIVTDPAAR